LTKREKRHAWALCATRKVEKEMKASVLARTILGSRSAFLAVYCSIYGGSPESLPQQTPNFAPPSLAHADACGKTFAEWAESLERSGIEVHQEGAAARFAAVENAPTFGRHPGAVAARAKTAQFYRALIQRAVELRGAHSFTIPAATAQGYAVTCHEALASAGRYRTAVAALAGLPVAGAAPADRPELAAAAEHDAERRKKLESDVGRAIAMHTTACAEAVGAGLAADHGPWFREVSTAEDVPRGVYVVGVEVWAGHPALSACQANLDPQHGGGVYGFGSLVPARKGEAACKVAQNMAFAGLQLPESTRFVTSRMDPDALVAAMLLSGRLRPELISMTGAELIEELARLDDGTPALSPCWQPSVKAHSVGDHPFWGGIGKLMIPPRPGQPDTRPSLRVLEILIAARLYGAGMGIDAKDEELQRAADAVDAYSTVLDRAQALVGRFDVVGSVAYAVDMPVGAGVWAAAYANAPIGVLSFVRPGTTGRAYTVAVCRDVGPAATEFVEAFERIAGEPDVWAGPKGGTLTGSRGPTRLALADVVRVANEAARECGITGAGLAHAALPALR
jgi:hypothetical protein